MHTLETTLRALHPMMPFITEEIWQRVPKADDAGKSIMVAPYPIAEADLKVDEEAERDVAYLQTAIVGVRTIRAEHQVSFSNAIAMHVWAEDAAAREVLSRESKLVARLTNAEVTIVDDAAALDAVTGPRAAVFYDAGIKVVVPDVIDVEKEKERLGRELKKVDKDLDQSSKKLANDKFVERAPADKVEAERSRHAELTAKKGELEAALSRLG